MTSARIPQCMNSSDLDVDPELRAASSEQSLLSRPDGSATFTQGDTSVMAAVYGPADVRLNKEIIDRATVEVIYKPKSGMPGIREKSKEQLIRNSCEAVILTTLHPRSSITIVTQEIQDSGSLLSCCVNASCMALMDAGIPMKCLVAAVTCMLDSDGRLVLDPTDKQAKDAQCLASFAFDSRHKKVITSSFQGSCTVQEYQSLLASCQTASQKVFDFYRTSVEHRLTKS
ncbi:exosome complex component RRP46-like isoform X2 [Acanthaster planci]|uniref:Exosome complex component RRP46 n=1 Tax=Acanthaster planci TaxID=133434 RepID=A0A8B7YDV1_ACAPL|nr:exosome complex component RRP46-like isoform X2 [Acanthaster planci]